MKEADIRRCSELLNERDSYERLRKRLDAHSQTLALIAAVRDRSGAKDIEEPVFSSRVRTLRLIDMLIRSVNEELAGFGIGTE